MRECQFLVQDRRGNMMLVDGAEPNSIGCMFEVHHISPHLPNSSGGMFEVHRTPRPLTQTPELRAPPLRSHGSARPCFSATASTRQRAGS